MKKQGISLIEMLVYISILSVFVLTLLQLQLTQEKSTFEVRKSIFQDQQFYALVTVLEDVISQSEIVLQPKDNEEVDILELVQNGKNTSVYLLDKKLYAKKNGHMEPLHDGSLSVEKVMFSRSSNILVVKLVTSLKTFTTSYVLHE